MRDDELADLRAEVERLRAENTRLAALLRLTPAERQAPGPQQQAVTHPGIVTQAHPAAAKVALYRSLFRARDDVYAVRWQNERTGQAGWMPAVEGGWRKGMRRDEARSSRSGAAPHASRPRYLRLTDEVIARHLAGDVHIGLYPIVDGDRTHWLAADFDGTAAVLDALAYLKAARANNVPAALEVSQSGLGAHAWVFFIDAVEAAQARRIGLGLIREASAIRGRMNLSAYDRLFPSQDVLPRGGFGNLIAAPLQGRARRRGTTLFLDLATMEPHDDQWAYLSQLDRMSRRDVARAVTRLGSTTVGMAAPRIARAAATRIEVSPPPQVHVTVAGTITVRGTDLTPPMASTLMHAASLRNPEFDERQRHRRSTWDVPRFIRSYDETLEGDLVLPRGLIDVVRGLTDDLGSSLVIDDRTVSGTAIETTFTATLRPEQREAVDTLAGHQLGVLVAPPGAGKTVMACALIDRHATSTLVLVDRKALADQWRQRIDELLGIKPGQLGGGRTKRTHVIDIATLQTLARRDDVDELTRDYGLVIVDECHHVPAAAFEAVVKQIPARRWVGLTATPYRRDGLDDLIGHQVGPTRWTIETTITEPGQLLAADEPDALERILVTHPTAYAPMGPVDPRAPGGMAAIYRDLIADDDRLAQITADVEEGMARGRQCLVLTQWTAHVDRIADALREKGRDPLVLTGRMKAGERKQANERLASDEQLLLVATGPYIGEGFDCPRLDTLYLAAPIAFKGRIVQYAGRILRPWPGKVTAEVHDYVDELVPVIASSLPKRTKGYRSLGFTSTRPG